MSLNLTKKIFKKNIYSKKAEIKKREKVIRRFRPLIFRSLLWVVLLLFFPLFPFKLSLAQSKT
ncbi:MAG: hypothetical protein N3B16_11370, partial [Candidatus Aminicenantes bacterium]|nr:hypothetical protein [Candidatus Aminicenantes bacterium]